MPSVEAPVAVSRRRAWLGTVHGSRDDDGSEGVSALGDGFCTLDSPPPSSAGRARPPEQRALRAPMAMALLFGCPRLLIAALLLPTPPVCPAAPRGHGDTCGRSSWLTVTSACASAKSARLLVSTLRSAGLSTFASRCAAAAPPWRVEPRARSSSVPLCCCSAAPSARVAGPRPRRSRHDCPRGDLLPTPYTPPSAPRTSLRR